jgi:hypothetical protein
MKKLLPFLSLLICGNLFGDGWITPPPGYFIKENSQVAILKYDNGNEDLIIDVEISGDATDFAWVIPLPGLPSIDSVDAYLFYKLQSYTRPIYKQRGWGCSESALDIWGNYEGEGNKDEPTGVSEVGSGVIGKFAYTILEAQSSSALYDYLTEHGYEYPDEATSVLEYYINKDWNYFVVARADTSSTHYYSEIGVKLSFACTSPVYPMKITSLSGDDLDLILYVISDQKMRFEGATLKFAGPISSTSLEGYPDILDKSYFLTKFKKEFTKEELDDVELETASNDKEFREVIFYSYSADPLIFAALVAFIVFKRKKRRRA